MNRDQTLAHLEIHGWVPIVNSAQEHGVLRPADGLAFLAWRPNPSDGYGSGWQTMRITPGLATYSTVRECTWDEVRDEELNALVEEQALEQH